MADFKGGSDFGMNVAKKYLVIGASSEVGCAFIKDLLLKQEQISVFAHFAHNRENLKQLADEFQETDFTIVQADLEKQEDTDKLIEEIRKWGCPDALVYLPAGKFEYLKLKNLSWDIMERELSISVRGFALVCKAVLPLMAGQRYGKVAVMLTEYTLGMPPKFMPHYITAKYALLGFMKAMASEYGKKGININALSPAMIETKFLSNIDERIIEMNGERNSLNRNVKIEEVVRGLQFLLSDGSDYMSGVNLNMSGGNY